MNVLNAKAKSIGSRKYICKFTNTSRKPKPRCLKLLDALFNPFIRFYKPTFLLKKKQMISSNNLVQSPGEDMNGFVII